MVTLNQRLLVRFARASLRMMLRVWPGDSRAWGHALAAELGQIQRTGEVLRWTLGGLMLFARFTAAHFFSWIKLPPGARLTGNPGAAENGPLRPRRSRLFTAGVLLATAIVFFLPQNQEAFTTITASWRGYNTSSSDQRALERLGSRAGKENDARTLAFVAMTLPHSEQATAYAKRAIALDATLFWINALRMDGRPEFAPPSQADLTRLLDSDKGNAYPELLAARVRFQPRYVALVRTHGPSDQEVEALASSDPEWLAHMQRAFASTRYDSYVNRHWELTREVWSREHSFSPAVAFHSLWAHSLPDMSSIETYTHIQFRKAHEAVQAGQTDRAESLLKRVDTFAELMGGQTQTTIEGLVGLHLSREANIELLRLYQSTNRPAESARASQRIEEIAAMVNSRWQTIHARAALSQGLEGRALFVDCVTVAGLVLLFATIVSLLIVELRSGKRSRAKIGRAFVCLAADWAPVTCLLACIAMLWAFQPFAHILARARTVMTASDAWFTLHHEGLFRLSRALLPSDLLNSYHLWLTTTCALAALAAFILFRRFLFSRGTHS